MRSSLQAVLAISFFSLLVSPLSPANSEIYRVVEKDGTVIYTDEPAPDADAKAVELKPIQIVSPPQIPSRFKTTKTTQAEQSPYSTLIISSPEEKENLRNPTEITVTTDLSPDLKTGHQIRLLQNGKEAGTNASGTFIIEEPYRGEHTLKVQIVDHRNKVLLSSAPRTIYVYRHSVLSNPQPTPPIAPAP